MEGLIRKLEKMKKSWNNSSAEFKVDAFQCVAWAAYLNNYFSFDTVRFYHHVLNMRKPHHPNAWGSVSRMAQKRGLILDTGLMKPSARPKAHATKTTIYMARAWLNPNKSGPTSKQIIDLVVDMEARLWASLEKKQKEKVKLQKSLF